MKKKSKAQKVRLTKYEKQIERDLENEEFVTDEKSKEMIGLLQEAAVKHVNKTKNINIRITEPDLISIKTRASENGIPYQTLVSMVLHKFAKREIEVKI